MHSTHSVPGDSVAPVARLPKFRLAVIIAGLLGVFGLLGQLYLVASGLAQVRNPFYLNVFVRLYALHERPFLLLLLLFTLVTALLLRRRVELPGGGTVADRLSRLPAGVIAAAVLVVTVAGTFLVMHRLDFAMDEYTAGFQARIFASGQVTAPVPLQWQSLAWWMTPIFVTYQAEAHRWVAGYLPVYSMFRAVFQVLHAEWLLNPLFAATTVLLVDRVARRIWPGDDTRRLLSLAFLVTSSQFVVMSMTGYSMPAHLCLNLLWLLLYLRDDRASMALLPWVGALALGLHNPFPHALFVAPFLLRLLLRRRYGMIAYAGIVYLAAAAAWLNWLHFAADPSTISGGLLASFHLPNAMLRFVNGLNLTLLLSWQTPVLAVLLLYAMLCWRHLSATERDLAVGLILTFAFYLLFPADQGHGWGYRYVYGALGNVMLLGAAGAMLASREMDRSTLRALVVASLAISVVFQLPLRMTQASRFVQPFARANAFIRTRPAPIVAVDVSEGWYSRDLVRNDPLFQHGPVVIALLPGRGPSLDDVPPALRDSIYVISRADFARFGFPLFPPRAPQQRR